MADDAPAVVGMLPAAGRGQRLGPLPCSKEIFPIGFQPVCRHLFEKFSAAGIKQAYVIVRSGKWDIPAYFGAGDIVGVDIAYRVIADSLGPPDTLDRAYPFVRHNVIAFAFPDMLFGPDDVFRQLLDRLETTGAAAVLGLYPTTERHKMDMIDAGDDGRIRAIVLKPKESTLQYTWTCAVWRPQFTEYLHRFVERERGRPPDPSRHHGIDAGGDLPVGAVLQAAVKDGLSLQTVAFPDETFIDIGTPDSLRNALRRFLDG